MKRTVLFVALALAIVFAVALLNVNRAASDDHAIHKHQQQSQQQQKPPVVDGAATPGVIPNHAAQEVVLRLLTSDEQDRIGDRKKAYMRAYGFDENAQAALMLAAREYKRLVEPIEREADDIKDRNWPNPGSSARARLNELQRDKEAVIAGVISELHGRLQTYRSLDKWTNHIANTVKRKTKGFASELPRRIGFFRLFPDPFAAYAQAGGCDPTYVYSDGVYDSPSSLVYGYSSYSAGANNCGHEFNVATQITHTGAPTASGTDYAVFNLDSGSGYYYDGNFFVQTTVEGYCPVASVTFPAGNNSDTVTVAPFVQIGQFGNFSSTVLSEAGSVTIPLNYTVSIDASGKTFSVTFGAGVEGNIGLDDLQVTGGGTITVGGTTPTSVTATYSTNTTRAGKFKAAATAESGTVNVLGSPAYRETTAKVSVNGG